MGAENQQDKHELSSELVEVWVLKNYLNLTIRNRYFAFVLKNLSLFGLVEQTASKINDGKL